MKEINYMEMQDYEIRKFIATQIGSIVFDNGRGMYPTDKFSWETEKFILGFKKEAELAKGEAVNLEGRIKSLDKKIEALMKIIEFYADKENYTLIKVENGDDVIKIVPIVKDKGKKARTGINLHSFKPKKVK